MRKKVKRIGMLFFGLFLILGFLASEEVDAKGGSKAYTTLVQDYKTVQIRVPSKKFLTDGLNYSLYFKSDKDRWAVQTSVYTRREDAENEDFQPAEKFSKGKTFRVGNKYYMDVKVKGLSYEITFSFTKKYKKFFEGLKEKDFIVEKDRGEEAYKNVINNYLISGISKEVIKEKVLPLQEFAGYEKADRLEEAKKIAKKFGLKEAYEKKKKMDLKRQKAGILLGNQFSGEEVDISLTRLLYAYAPLGYTPVKLDKEEKIAYFEMTREKEVLPILLVYNEKKRAKLKKGKEKGDFVEGTDVTNVYVLSKPLQKAE